MAIRDDEGKRLTPTEAAKEILISNAGNASYWSEQHAIDVEKLTPTESRKIDEAIDKQWRRLQKFFGYSGWKLG